MLSILLTLLLSMLLLFVFLLASSSSSIKSSRFFNLFVLTGVLTLGTSPRWFWLVRIANALVKHETSPLSPDTLRTTLPNQILFCLFLFIKSGNTLSSSRCKLSFTVHWLLPYNFSNSIYIRTALLVPVVCFADLVWIGFWTVWAEQHAPYTKYLPRSGRNRMNQR